jgi:hypothetical protein
MALVRLNNQSISSVTALPSGIPTGIILQIQRNIISGVTTHASSSFTDLVTQTITPSSSSNKILVMAGIGEIDQLDGRVGTKILRNGTDLGADAKVCGEVGRNLGYSGTEDHIGSEGMVAYLDSPSTTSQITYKLQINSGNGGTIRINNGSASRLFLYEIAN